MTRIKNENLVFLPDGITNGLAKLFNIAYAKKMSKKQTKQQTTNEMIVDVRTYDEIYDKHTKNCTSINIHDICRLVKHTDVR